MVENHSDCVLTGLMWEYVRGCSVSLKGFSTVSEAKCCPYSHHTHTYTQHYISQVLFPLFPLSGLVQTHLLFTSSLCLLDSDTSLIVISDPLKPVTQPWMNTVSYHFSCSWHVKQYEAYLLINLSYMTDGDSEMLPKAPLCSFSLIPAVLFSSAGFKIKLFPPLLRLLKVKHLNKDENGWRTYNG